MRILYNLMILIFLIFTCCQSPVTPENLHQLIPVQELPRELNECSGMVMLDDNSYLALNDGGDRPNLYLFTKNNRANPKIIRVAGAENDDWEELTRDGEFLYIGDFGNNGGTRHNLKIYKIKLMDLSMDEVSAEEIKFAYKEQTMFNRSNSHNFDCEAMICVGDSLYLFTKNRGNYKTDIYSLPKLRGKYSAHHLGEFDSGGMITGAAFRSSGVENRLVLVGYSEYRHSYDPFLLMFNHIEGTNFFRLPAERFAFDKKLQLESVLFNGDDSVLIASEEGKWSNGWIYKVNIRQGLE